MIHNDTKKHTVTIINMASIPYWAAGLKEPCGYTSCRTDLVIHKTLVTESITIIEKRFE